MKTLKTLYPYLSEGELAEGKVKAANLLIKVGKFSEQEAAESFVADSLHKKAAGEDLNSLEREVVTFMNRFKREKSPQYKALVNARSIFREVNNSSITI